MSIRKSIVVSEFIAMTLVACGVALVVLLERSGKASPKVSVFVQIMFAVLLISYMGLDLWLCFRAAKDRPENSVDRQAKPLNIALRITFLIVGPVPLMLIALHIAAAIALTVNLVAWDSSYYQDHRWCAFLACIVAGTVCFALKRIPFFESGLFVGPLIVALGIYILLK